MSELSDKFEAFWILDEHVLTSTVRVDSTANGHDWTTSNAEWAAGPCTVPNAIFYHAGTAQALSQASSSGLSLGSFSWEINGWGYSSSTGGPAGAECYIAKSVGFPAALCYAVYLASPTIPTLTLRVRNAANSADGTVSIVTGIATDTWFNWGAYHDGSVLGVYINGGTPTTIPWTDGVLANAGDLFTTIQAWLTGRKGFRNYNMGVVRSILSQAEREYLAGLDNGDCPPIWPFDDSPTSDMAFEGYFARIGDKSTFADQDYGTKTYFLIDSPISGQTRKVEAPMANTDTVQAGESVFLKMRRDGDDPNDPSEADCLLRSVRVDYYTRLPS